MRAKTVTKSKKERLDKWLVHTGLVETRERAQGLILAGKIRTNGLVVTKSGHMIDADAMVEVAGAEHPFVSRGGVKLQGALAHFKLQPAGLVALDVGASTGGFTDCLLQQGALRVHALDVGYGQLAWVLRQDRRVVVWERQNIRHFPAGALDELVALVVVDVSFIGLRQVLPSLQPFVAPKATVLALVKPQFEAGKENIQKKGLVKDANVHAEVVKRVLACGNELGWQPVGWCTSPLVGKKSGNREFFACWKTRQQDCNSLPQLAC